MTTEFRVQPDYLNAVADEALKTVLERMRALAKAMVDKDGMAFGDIALSPEQIIAKVEFDTRSGIMDNLAVVNPSEYKRRMSALRDASKRLNRIGG